MPKIRELEQELTGLPSCRMLAKAKHAQDMLDDARNEISELKGKCQEHQPAQVIAAPSSDSNNNLQWQCQSG